MGGSSSFQHIPPASGSQTPLVSSFCTLFPPGKPPKASSRGNPSQCPSREPAVGHGRGTLTWGSRGRARLPPQSWICFSRWYSHCFSSASEGQNTTRGFSRGPGHGRHGMSGEIRAGTAASIGNQPAELPRSAHPPRGAGDTPAPLGTPLLCCHPPPALPAALLSHQPSRTAPAPPQAHQALTLFNPKPGQEQTPRSAQKPSLTSTAGFQLSTPPSSLWEASVWAGTVPGCCSLSRKPRALSQFHFGSPYVEHR